MSGTAYKLLGFAVWHGGRWYLRRRLPVRKLALAAGLGLAGAATVGVAVRRAAGS